MGAESLLRVQGLTAYPPSAASARVRVANFHPFLRPEGIDLTHRPTLNDEEYAVLVSEASPARKAAILLRSAARGALAAPRGGDALLLIHRLVLLAPVPGVDPPRRLDAYDFDDALVVGSPAAANSSFQWLKRESQRAVAAMRRARLVIAANPTLAETARPFARRVEMIPSCVDPVLQPLREHADRETVTIGWIGSHTTVAYLAPVLSVLRRIVDRGVRVRLVVVGGDTGVREPWIEHRRWTLSGENADIADFDVGIMPLPDTEWARGKAGYKLLQYFAAGVPAVASPVGINGQLVSEDRGIAATTADQWETALLELVRDPERRRSTGAACRAYVEREYSYQRWAPRLAGLLRELA